LPIGNRQILPSSRGNISQYRSPTLCKSVPRHTTTHPKALSQPAPHRAITRLAPTGSFPAVNGSTRSSSILKSPLNPIKVNPESVRRFFLPHFRSSSD